MPFECGRCTWLRLGSPGEEIPEHFRTCPEHPVQQALRQEGALRGVSEDALRLASIAAGELLLLPSAEHENVLAEAVPGLTWGRLRALVQLEDG